ncbi:DUF4334 domain-containing protein [Telmatospirillum sp. J64-1]|uniref:DUF4334 domain-containing protein n=1 Tax=Telmatospirillum sp. J64-1 TaxID=2502183 RepID=UPI00115CDFCC|nr:DUF4334 domain-containing protein [Telmatospirillum sp. J64-1]
MDGERSSATQWLLERERRGVASAEALDFFDAQPPARIADCLGRWRGGGLHTGHPMDGLLEALGWYGKEMLDAERVHPLLFQGRDGAVFPLNPALMPVSLAQLAPGLAQGRGIQAAFAVSRRLLRTSRPKARLRMMEHRGVVTAAMIYDDLPICDLFRRIDRNTLLGVMDLRGMERPFFFTLRREEPDSSGQRE